MPPPTTTCHGVTVLGGAPATGGELLNEALKTLLKRAPQINVTALVAPGVNHDAVDTAGIGIEFHELSYWIHTTAVPDPVLYVLLDSTPTAAVWQRVGMGLVTTFNDWQPSVLNILDFTAAEPGGPGVGDRYINTGTGASSVTAQAVTADRIYEWNGVDWDEFIPTEGTAALDENTNDLMGYDGAAWLNLGSFADIKDLTDGGNADALHIHNIIIDVTPQLGGNLDTNGFKIGTAGNADLCLCAHGTGALLLGAPGALVGALTNTVVQGGGSANASASSSVFSGGSLVTTGAFAHADSTGIVSSTAACSHADSGGTVGASADDASAHATGCAMASTSFAGGLRAIAGGVGSSALSGGVTDCAAGHADSCGTSVGNCAHADSSGVVCGVSSHADSCGIADGAWAHADSAGSALAAKSHADTGGTVCSGACGSVAHSGGIVATGACEAHARGPGALATRKTEQVEAGGQFAAAGDAIAPKLVLRGEFTETGSPAFHPLILPQKFIIPNNTAVGALVTITGVAQDGDTVRYMRSVAINNIATTVALVGAVQTVGTDIEDEGTCDIQIVADDTAKALDIQVKGKASEEWRWVAVIRAEQIGFPT